MKIIDRRKATETTVNVSIPRELSILRSLKHQSIVKAFTVLDSPQHCCIVQELAVNGDLHDCIAVNGKFPEAQARWLFRQLCSAVAYCHAVGVVHGDIKPENVMLDAGMNIKLGGE